MKIQFESELMKNHKHATIMKPGGRFQAVQTSEGDSLLFSIGTDGAFYLTQEKPGDVVGWTQQNLASTLPSGSQVKSFDIAQDPDDGTIQIVLVITGKETDELYVSLGNSNTDSSWANGVKWKPIPFDGSAKPPSMLDIYATYLRQSKKGYYIAADVVTDTDGPIALPCRYYVNPNSKGPHWISQSFSSDWPKDKVISCLGRRKGDASDGIYTLVSKTSEVSFAPLGDTAQTSLKLQGLATAIATTPDPDGDTHLFVAIDTPVIGLGGTGDVDTGNTLYLFPPDKQQKDASGLRIFQSPLLAGVTALYGTNSGDVTMVWGLNATTDIFYLQCAAGQEIVPSAWSTPLTLLTGVLGISTFLHNQNGGAVLFAQTSDKMLVQLSQDPVTTHWHQRQIVLPTTGPDDLIEVNSFTTRVEITDDSNLPLPNTTVALKSTSPVSVYVNDVYHVLSNDTALTVTSDETGVLAIVQETDSLSAVCYNLTVDSVTLDVNPMDKMMGRLADIKSASDLPAGASGDTTAAIKVIQQLCGQSGVVSTLPANGSIKPGATGSSQPDTTTGGIRKIECKAGDLFKHFKQEADKVDHYYLETVGEIEHLCIKIGDDVYHTALDCCAKVAKAAEFVLAQLKIAWDTFVTALDWPDILRTHAAIKNVLRCCAQDYINGLSTTKQDIITFFSNLQTDLNNLPQLAITETPGSVTASSQPGPGLRSPHAHWGLQQLKNNLSNATTTAADPSLPSGVPDALQILKTFVSTEKDAWVTAITQLQTEVVDHIGSLKVTDILKDTATALGDLVLKTDENILTALISLLESIVQGAMDWLESTITIPVLSKLYKDAAKQPLSGLDLACLVIAIPVTDAYRQNYFEAPFPDDDATKKLAAAPDLASIQNLCFSTDGAPAEASGRSASQTASTDSSKLSKPEFWSCIFNLMAFFSARGMAVVQTAKYAISKSDADIPGAGALAITGVALYIPYISPNFSARLHRTESPANKLNQVVTGVSLGVALGEAATYKFNLKEMESDSPSTATMLGGMFIVLESILNTAWLAPAVALYKEAKEDKDPSAVATLVGDCFFDLGGILAPGGAFTEGEVQAGFLIAIGLCTLGYGYCCGAEAFPALKKASGL